VIVSEDYERSSTNGCVQGIDICLRMLLELAPCPMPRKTVKHNYFYPPRLHRPLITVLPALTGAAITPLANSLTFIAAGAAVGFIRCCLLFFKGAHGLVVPPRLGSFLPVRTDSSGRATEKGKAPAGYERNGITKAWWLTPSIGKIKLW
jgi:hypothetical protein